MAGINNIYLIVIMHEEHRPYHAEKFPHNPVRSTFQAEDATISFFPDMKRYDKIKPVLSSYDWIRETDWLQMTVDECRKRGLGVGAEISHFPIPKSLLMENPQYRQQNIDGEPIDQPRFCPNQPDVRHFVLALFEDLAANYDLDYIQTCQYIFSGGFCYCEHCIRAAETFGINLESTLPVMRKDDKSEREVERWKEFRRLTTTQFYKEIAEVIRKENPNCHLRLNDVYTWGGNDPLLTGLDLTAVGQHLGSLVNQDHQEQRGRVDEDFADRIKWLSDNRQHLGYDKPLLSGIATRMNASPDLVKRGIKVAVQHPAKIDGLALKHYDGASFSLLRAFKQGMIEAGVQGLTPTIGKEVEEMELDGYKVFDEELAEEWGVQTDGEGKAVYKFDQPSATYDVRITYFDGPTGQSNVKLVVAGEEKASFTMDEDSDCWRWRVVKGMKINKGDTITLVGRADGNEKARLDYIEYIAK
jgi:hypothetical protein